MRAALVVVAITAQPPCFSTAVRLPLAIEVYPYGTNCDRADKHYFPSLFTINIIALIPDPSPYQVET